MTHNLPVRLRYSQLFEGLLQWILPNRNRVVASESEGPSHVVERDPDKLSESRAGGHSELDQLIDRTLTENRCARLLSPTVGTSLHGNHLQSAHEALHKEMAVVPQGPITMPTQSGVSDDGRKDLRHCHNPSEASPQVVQLDAFYLDRYPVTNQQFKQFVDAGGYEQMEHWVTQIWPAVVEFVDRSGHPGPRYWQQGTFTDGRHDHPVVGVSWYEAAAYAHWVGKRLPQDAEWVKAGSWPVEVVPGRTVQRRFPWGDSMDRSLANLWAAGVGDTVPVDDFRQGVSVGGVYQLIGNVWEWTGDVIGENALTTGTDPYQQTTPMVSIRGAAYDTYFESQASCHFRSAECPIARKHNIGFRCALSVADVIGTVDGETVPALPAASQLESDSLVPAGGSA